MFLRGVREFFDSHKKPFFKATSNSGQMHTFKSPTTRLKGSFSVTEGQVAFFYSCASKVGTLIEGVASAARLVYPSGRPRPKQRFVMGMLDTVLQQDSR